MAKDAKKAASTKAKTQPKDNSASKKASQAARPAQRQLMLHAQYVKDLSFENPNAVAAHLEPSQQHQVDIGVNVNGDKINDTQYEVRLHITAKASTEERALFLVDLTYAAIVSVQDAAPEEINPLIMIEGPRMIFPFARAIISNMTRDGGFMPLNLQPVDFVNVYRHSLEQQRQEAAEQTKQ